MLKKIIKKIFFSIPLKNIVIFESAPDFSDNTKAVYDEMIYRGIQRKYKFVWLVHEKNNLRRDENSKCVFINSFAAKLYKYRAKCIICCNSFVTTDNPKQFRIYLGHGNPLKNTKGYYEIPDSFKYIVASSEGMKELRSRFYNISKERLFVLGYPRNDVFAKGTFNLKSLFGGIFKKIIVWYPTVRQFKSGNQTGSSHAFPIIWNNEIAKELNNCAKKENILIVVKPHFAQDLSFIDSKSLSNILFIDDLFFARNGLTSYQFVANCDALLTDYSSIYYDYSLCDKPIGLIWEDYEEYEKKPGFAVDMTYAMKGGVKIYDIEDLKRFVINISLGIDELKNERREIRDFANLSDDGANSKRVTKFIIEKAKL